MSFVQNIGERQRVGLHGRSLLRLAAMLAMLSACKLTPLVDLSNKDWPKNANSAETELRQLLFLSRGCEHEYQAAKAKKRALNALRARRTRRLLQDAVEHLDEAIQYFEDAQALTPGAQLCACRENGKPPKYSVDKPNRKCDKPKEPATGTTSTGAAGGSATSGG